MAPVNILHTLNTVRQEAQRNAAVLDHISLPCRNQNRSHQPSTSNQPQLEKQNNNNHNSYHSNFVEDESPISKRILTSIFSSLDKSSTDNKHDNYIFIENDLENHFLIGLVLPLIARLLVVSYPGLLCIVQLPGHDLPPEWAQTFYDEYDSNGSNRSKSGAPTTPSPQDTSRTPSPSDDGVESGERKPVSPDTHTDTPQVFYGQEDASKKQNASSEGSPSPENLAHMHRALRLICNGFEVLTGKMPPPKQNMGEFTLATVGWDKAGVIKPQNSSKGVDMSFSNGMTVSTEGIVVTFTNGSLCLLTMRDPIAGLDDMKVSDITPVIVFSFASRGQLSIGNLRSLENDPNTATIRAKQHCLQPNFFFVEIGPKSLQDTCHDPHPQSTSHLHNNQSIPNGHVNPSSTSKQTKNDSHPSQQNKPYKPGPVLPLTIIPRAVPLFINTIHRVFLDPPDMDWADDVHDYEPNKEPNMYNDYQKRNRTEQQQTKSQERIQDQQENAGEDQGKKISLKEQANPEKDDTEKPTVDDADETRKGDTTSAPASQPTEKTQYPTSTSVPVPTSTPVPSASTQGHHSYYNYYGYPSHHGYPNTHPNYHVVQTPPPGVSNPVMVHHGPPINRAQNGYYVGGPPPPVPSGHAPYHARGAYPHHSYYSVPTPSSVMQPNHGANGQWHPGVAGVHHPQPPLSHSLPDTRGDITVQYPSHNTVPTAVAPQYSAPYYVTPPTRPNGPTPVENHVHGNVTANPSAGHSIQGGYAANETTRTTEIGHAAPVAANNSSAEKWSSEQRRQMSANGLRVPQSRDTGTNKSTEKDEDREKALEALVDMGECGSHQNELRRSTEPGTESMQARNVEIRRPVDTNSREHKELKRKGSEIDRELKDSQLNGEIHLENRRSNSMNNNEQKETNSSTSTNSQGVSLKGKMTGTSPQTGLGTYAHSQPWQKKPRQR